MVGVAAILFGTALYAIDMQNMSFVTPERAAVFVNAAIEYVVLLAAGVSFLLVYFYWAVAVRIERIRSEGSARLSPSWAVPYVLSIRRYRRVFLACTTLYGLFYAYVTSVIVYQPGVDFAAAGSVIPSAAIAPCCGEILTVPFVSIYLTNHLGILLVPLTLILLATVSVLVGLNSALALFAYDSAAGAGRRGTIGVLGAAIGLFTGCPTCAGLFFANLLGGTGAVTLAGLIGYYQPVFILLSVPVLVLTLYLMSGSLSKVYREGCVYLNGREPSPTSR